MNERNVGQGRSSGLLLVVGGSTLVLLGLTLFGGVLIVLGPIPDTFGEFAIRWAVRGLAVASVFGGLWCAWTGWKRQSAR